MTERTQLFVADLMTQVVMALYATDTLDAARIQLRFGHVRHLPVIDEEARVIGLVSERDLLSHWWREGSAQPVPVGPLMSTQLVVVTGETPIQEAVALLVEHRVSCLPVVDREGRLAGILTEGDFLRHVYRSQMGTDYVPSWSTESSEP